MRIFFLLLTFLCSFYSYSQEGFPINGVEDVRDNHYAFINAKILGIDNVTGTIMVGKDANIIISKGDILDMKSSVIEYAFITGRKVNLDGKQQILYDRFKRKYSN